VDSPGLRFATALFRAAAGDGESNFVCSPWSVASALAALAPGTESDARKEIAAAVGSSDRLRAEAALVVGSSGPEAPLKAPGKRWPPRYAARRIAWHALDHAWEIEDRST